MNSEQAYPKWQLKMEALQLKLNRASVLGKMSNVGKYNTEINQLWDKVHSKE